VNEEICVVVSQTPYYFEQGDGASLCTYGCKGMHVATANKELSKINFGADSKQPWQP